jgi:hypothetical protein
MTNVIHKFLIYLSIYFSLTCFGLSFSPSSQAGVQLRQWFKSPGYGVSARALTPYPVSIVTRLRAVRFGVRIPEGPSGFSVLHDPRTGPGVQTRSRYMCTAQMEAARPKHTCLPGIIHCDKCGWSEGLPVTAFMPQARLAQPSMNFGYISLSITVGGSKTIAERTRVRNRIVCGLCLLLNVLLLLHLPSRSSRVTP